MTVIDLKAQELDELAALAVLTPEPRRAERVRQACHAALARRHQRVTALSRRTIWRQPLRLLALATVSAAWVLYVSSLLTTTFNLERFMR